MDGRGIGATLNMPWHNLGSLVPTEIAWLPFRATFGHKTSFRITYAAPRDLDRIDSYGWLAWRYVGGSEALPPTPVIRVYPDARGRLLEIPFHPELFDLGYTSRIFEIKRNRRDVINWTVQLEELT